MPAIKIDQITFPKKIIVTDQEIDVSKLSGEQKKFHIDLANEIISLYESKNAPRLTVGIVGPSGSGKSVSAVLLKEIFKQLQSPVRFEEIGLDGFTYPNSYLLSRQSGGRPLKAVKGRFDTFDAEKLLQRLLAFKGGSPVYFPAYSRTVHDPIEDVLHISDPNAILLVEGLWLLHEGEVWEKIRNAIDFTFFFDADKNVCKHNTTKRHERGGRNSDDASRQWEDNDSKNYDMVITEKARADKILNPWKWSR